MDPEEDRCFITLRREKGEVKKGTVPHGYFGDLEAEYERRNGDYIEEMERKRKSGLSEKEPVPDKKNGKTQTQGKSHPLRNRTEDSERKEIPDFSAAPVPCSARPILFDRQICVGCNRCAEVCQVDILVPSSEKGAPPVVMFPGECYYCGACVMVCPKKGALRLQHPVMNRAKFVSVKPEPEN